MATHVAVVFLVLVDLRSSLGVIIVNNWLCLSVCPHVCLSRHFKLLRLVSPWNRAIFWTSVLHAALYKTLFLDYWFRPPNARNLLPKICTKLPISRLVWQIDRRCLGLLWSFRGWPIQWNHAKCCGPTLVAMATKFGLGAEIQSPTAYRLVLVFVPVVVVIRYSTY